MATNPQVTSIAKGQGQPPASHQTQPQQPQGSHAKDISMATICRIGQESVQEIVGRAQEIFNHLRALQPPIGAAMPG